VGEAAYMKQNLHQNLAEIDMFKSLNEDELDLLTTISTYKTFQNGSTLFYEKEELEFIYFLLEGEVKLYKVDRFDSEIFLSRLKEKSFIYTVSNMCTFASGRGVFYSAEAISDCRVLLINAKKFKSLFMTKPEILKSILEESYKSILQLQYILNRDIVFDGIAKVAYMICNDLESFNSMKKHEIAYSLHLQPETLSRILKKLVRNKYIELEKGKVTTLDKEGLKEIYE